MAVSKFLALVLLSLSLWLSAQAQAARTTGTGTPPPSAGQSRPKTTEDKLARHLSAAQTYQLSGDLERAAVENSAVLAIALGRLGVIAIQENQLERAIQLLSGSLAVSDDTRVRTNLAFAYMEQGELDKALAEAQAVTNVDDQNGRAHHILGKLLYTKGDYAGARTALEKAATLEPDLESAFRLAMTYLNLKQLDRARLVFEDIQETLKDSASAHILFGRAYQQAGFSREAEREFKQALAINPHTPRAHMYLGYTILQQGDTERFAEARKEFEQELKINPQDFYATYFLGVLASTDNDHSTALTYLQEAVRLNPNSPEAFLFLGQSQAELGDPAAEKSLRRAIELNGAASRNSYQIRRAHFLLGQLLLKSGRKAEAEKELATSREVRQQMLESSRQTMSEILGQVMDATKEMAALRGAAAATSEASVGEKKSVGPGGKALIESEQSARGAQEAAKYLRAKGQLGEVIAEAYHNLGVIAAQQGQLAASLDRFAAAAQWKPDLKGLDRNQGIVSFRASHYEQAIAPLSRHIAVNPDDGLVRRMLGVSYYMTHDFRRAVETLKPLEPLLADDPESAYIYGVSLIRMQNYAAASRLFTRLVQQRPKAARMRFYVAQGFGMMEDYESALREFRSVSELDPGMLQAHYGAGQSLIRLNRLEEAEKEFRQELLLNPSDVKSKYHLAYVLLERRQQFAEAMTLLEEAIKASPDYAEARYQLGKALIEQGDINKAIEQLEVAARTEPAKDYIHYQLSIAYRRASRIADADRELQLYKQLKAAGRNRELPGNAGAGQNVP